LRMPNFGKIKYTKDQLMSAVAAVRDGDEEEENSEEFYVLFRLYEVFAKKKEKYFERMGTPVEPEEITVDSMKVVTDKEIDQPEDNEEIIERQLSSQSQVDAVEIASNEHFQTKEVGANMGIQEDNLLKTPEKNLSNEEKKTLRRSEVRTLEDCLIWPETPKRKNIRKTERMPYVLTSKKWRALFRNKEEKKAEEERKKEERKRKREMNNGGKIAKRKRSVESTKHVKHGRKVTELSTLSSHENPKDSSLINVSLSYDQNVQATTSPDIGTNILEKRKDTSEEPNKLLSSGVPESEARVPITMNFSSFNIDVILKKSDTLLTASVSIQQDETIAHTGHGNLTLLQELFPGRLISRGSPDLSLCDAFLWGILKEQCFIPVSRTLDALREKHRKSYEQPNKRTV
ncbi:hypothetical protein ANN_08556, partial [Periplaneta americana]